MTKTINRIILTGGGTGGHIYPALSIYQKLKQENDHLEVLFIGTETGLESEIVPKEGIAFKTIKISGLQRKISVQNIKTIWNMLSSTWSARKMIKAFRPDIVIGTGGYVAGPVMLAASMLKIPTFIHEQNSIAGLTNKFLAKRVDKIGICFVEAEQDFEKQKQKLVLTGNPRGQEVFEANKNKYILSEQFSLRDDIPTVLFFGGSRGAPAINRAALENYKKWQELDFQVIIATGNKHYAELIKEYQINEVNHSNVRIVPYIDNMPAVLQAVDLVVSRSGATTITELTALGLPSILIPSPYVTANHQEYNALSLVNKKAAKMIKETELTSDNIFQMISNLMADATTLKMMSDNAYALGIRDARDRIYSTLQSMI